MKSSTSIVSFVAGAAVMTAATYFLKSSNVRSIKDNLSERIKRAKDKSNLHKVYIGYDR